MERMLMIPKKDWNELQAVVNELSVRLDLSEVISETAAAELLGVKPESMGQARSRGTIPEDCYIRPKIGRPVYFKAKLLNLK